jgi:elongation factor 1-alpha
MTDNKDKQHVSVVVAGHVDSGKSTTVGHLLFQLGGISEREMQKLREEAKAMNKDSFAFAFYTDKQKESRVRGITINYATKEFYTPTKHYTIVDAPGHKDFIKNMISGSSTADAAMLLVPADGGFTVATQKENRKANQVQGQTRMHARLLYLLGIKQLIVCVNKMDDEKTAAYKEERFKEISDEMKLMLQQVGWPKAYVDACVPVLPISGWIGDNLFKKSDKMPWWKGTDVKRDPKDKEAIHVATLHDALDTYVTIPARPVDKALRIPVGSVHNIKGVGTIVCGRIEQGKLKPTDELIFIPTHTDSNACTGRVFSIEQHHKNLPEAAAGDNIGMCVKGLNKDHMPKPGDIAILASDKTLQPVKSFTVQAQVISCANEFKQGYCPIGFVRTARSPCKLVSIDWRMGKETNGAKVEKPASIKLGDMVQCKFENQQPFVVDAFKNCENLARVAFMDGSQPVLLGKILDVEHGMPGKEEDAPKEKGGKDKKEGGKAEGGKKEGGKKEGGKKEGGKKAAPKKA